MSEEYLQAMSQAPQSVLEECAARLVAISARPSPGSAITTRRPRVAVGLCSR
jgi:hypothetical protein